MKKTCTLYNDKYNKIIKKKILLICLLIKLIKFKLKSMYIYKKKNAWSKYILKNINLIICLFVAFITKIVFKFSLNLKSMVLMKYNKMALILIRNLIKTNNLWNQQVIKRFLSSKQFLPFLLMKKYYFEYIE